jgi:integrase
LGCSAPAKTQTFKGTPHKPTTINRYLAVIKHMYNLAMSEGLADRNPVFKVKPMVEKDSVRKRLITLQELDRLVRCSPQYLRDVILTGFYTGMRKGEIIELTGTGSTWRKAVLSWEFTTPRPGNPGTCTSGGTRS